QDDPRTIVLRDVATGELIGRPIQDPEAIKGVGFSPDSKLLLAKCANSARDLREIREAGSNRWEIRLWETAGARPATGPLPLGGDLSLWAFSPDSRFLLTFALNPLTKESRVRLWDVAAGKAVGEPLPHSAQVSVLAFSPDSSTCVVAAGGQARLWHTATGQP